MTEDAERAVKDALAKMEAFAADMKAQSIHIGMGAIEPRCVTCGAPWPCVASKKKRQK